MIFNEFGKVSLRLAYGLIPLFSFLYVWLKGNVKINNIFLIVTIIFLVALIIRIFSESRGLSATRRSIRNRRSFADEFSIASQVNIVLLLLAFVIVALSGVQSEFELLADNSAMSKPIATLISRLCDICSFAFVFVSMGLSNIGLSLLDSNFSEEEVREIIRQEQRIREDELLQNK